jgi:hypothetical protein
LRWNADTKGEATVELERVAVNAERETHDMRLNITIELMPEIRDELAVAKACTNKIAALGIGHQVSKLFEQAFFGTGIQKVETQVSIQRNVKLIPRNQR